MVDSNRNCSWRLFPSKKSPGEFYYFNPVTGKSVWKLEDLTTKCTDKDCTHNSTQNFQHYPEPHTPPDTQMTQHTSRNCNRCSIPPVFLNYPFNPYIYHNSPHMCGPQPPLPYYFPNFQEFNPCHCRPEALNKKVYMDQIVQTDILDEVEEKKNSKSQYSQISPVELAEFNPKDEIVQTEVQTEEKLLALNNKLENSKQFQCVKENKENRDLRERLNKNSIKKIGDSKSTQNTKNLDQKYVTFRLDHFKEDRSTFSSDSLFYRDTKPDKPKPISIHFLRTLKGTKTEKEWYIVVDAEILIDDFDFIYYFVKTDNKCRLFIPHMVHSELQATSKGKSRGRNATIAARQSLRKIEMYTNFIDVENEYMRELNVTSSVDSILNSCLEIMKTKHHAVLITNNVQLLKKAKNISVHCYTLKDLDRDGYETVTDRDEKFERMEYEIEKSNNKNIIDFENAESDLKMVMQQYKCTFTQVLEDALGNMLQASNKQFNYNPPWILSEAISCVNELYKGDENISNILQQFSSYLTKISTKDGQICNYAPGDLIELFGYGVALLHYLREKKNQNCLSEAEEILRRNLRELSGSGKDLAVDEKLIPKMKDEKENSSQGCENVIRVFGRDLNKVKINSENYINFDNAYNSTHKKTNNLLNITNVNNKSDDKLYNEVDKSNLFMTKTNQQNKVSNGPKIIRNLKPIEAFEEKLNGSKNVFRNNDVKAAKDKEKSLKMLMIEEKDFAKDMTKDVETLNFNHSNSINKKELNVEEFSDGDSHQAAYFFMRTFLSQLNHTFKIIHCFITETLSEWTEIQSDETRMNEARYKSVNILENLLKILDYLKSVVERESNEDTSVKSIVLRAGNIALNDRRVTRYKQVIMKCLEQGKILKKALKETMRLIYNETKSETESSIVFGPINIYE